MVWIWGIALRTGFGHTSPKNRRLPQTWEIRVTGVKGCSGRGPASSEPSLAWPEMNKGAETWRMYGALTATLPGPCPSLPTALLGSAMVFRVSWGPQGLPDLPASPWRMFEWIQDPPKMSSPTFTSTEVIQPSSHLHSLGTRLSGFKS